ncbi:MAG TPA: SLBB domain-containing protein [Gemmatimonadales bacterium]|nr:SLBB domain-containing protein [Gemmatimonadales bacterium]
MNRHLAAALGVAALFAAGSVPLGAQNPPTLPPPSEAAQLIQQAQQNPGLADMIRQRIAQSGMTPDQIRARLQASGYPATLLDSYLGQATPGTTQPVPGVQELSAIQALGLPPISAVGQVLPLDTGVVVVQKVPESGIFGVDVFRRTTTQFLPLLAGPVPPDYKLGAGDELVLILTGDVELSYDLPVTREGFILIPQVGQIFVSSLTLEQLNNVLRTRLGRVYSGIKSGSTRFSVSIANVRTNQAYVVGEAAQPGAYQISALGTVLTALYAAGGVTNNANLRAVEVRRLGKPVAVFDVYDYLLHGDTRNDIRLETGDVVYVPVRSLRAEISGAVVRPMIYEMKGTEALPDLIAAAGGLKPDAALRRIAIFRLRPPAERRPGEPPRAVVDVPVVPAGGLADAPVKIPPVALADGDSVVVDAVPPLAEGLYVAVSGMVQNPGQFPWHAGMTLRDLILLARGPRIGADLQQAEIARLPADRALGQLATTIRVPLDSSYLFTRDSTGKYVGAPGIVFPAAGSAPEVPLDPFDNVLILRQPNFELERTVDVTGQVKYPGTYSLTSKSERLADLIARAGGLTPQAYADGVKFIRTLNNAGRINLNLTDALRDSTSNSNLILQPDDSIFIPEFQPSIRVVGAVNAPGSVLWQPGEGLGYYISAAGGFAYTADEGRVSVRFANGEVKSPHHVLVFFKSSPAPSPGAEVFVPMKDLSHPTDYVALAGAIAQILSASLAMILIAKRF